MHGTIGGAGRSEDLLFVDGPLAEINQLTLPVAFYLERKASVL
jgi:hypothetical protein